MVNLLKETIDTLHDNNKTENDVLWVGDFDQTFKATWEDFEQIADFDYDQGYGGREIFRYLVIVGIDWWLERAEYDGSEWWTFKTMPAPKEEFTNKIMLFDMEYYSATENKFFVKTPQTEDEMLGLINNDYMVMADGHPIHIKTYLRNIDWFYEKYKLLFDGE